MKQNIKKGLGFFFTALAITSAIFIIGGLIHESVLGKTTNMINKIHATKLTLDDVMGKNLPPDPGAEADKTIAGIDANHNGIRDDVELAIFKAYPNQAKVRSALLQYALSLQLQMTLPVLNTDTFTEAIEYTENRASTCIETLSSRADIEKFSKVIDSYENFVKDHQLNNEPRKQFMFNLYENNIRGLGLSYKGDCDIDPKTLSN